MLEQDWTPDLRIQKQSFDHFCKTVNPWRKKAVAAPTLAQYHESIRRVLGYRKNVQGIALEALAITDLLDLSVLQSYVQWSHERGLSSNTLMNDMHVVIPIAQWQFHQAVPNESYRDPEPVKKIRTYLKTIVDRGDRPLVSDQACAERELTRQQCWEILAYLRWRCKDLEKQNGITNLVIDAWMDYLIIAFLVTTGGRQREVREMRCQQLSFEEDNQIIATLPPEGHKNGNKTGKGRQYPLFVGPMQLALNNDLEYYLKSIRPEDLDHDFLFFVRQNRSTQNGQLRRGRPILEERYLSILVPRIIACVTAHLYGIDQVKWTAPHDFRRIIATWVCTYGEPKHLAVFAELLGHSMDMLVKIYNKTHPGVLARQSPLAYDEIIAREERVKAFRSSDTSKLVTSMTTLSPTARAAMLQKLVRKLWYSLTQRKQNEVFEALSPAEREAIDS